MNEKEHLQVAAYMQALEHPLKEVINEVRKVIMDATPHLQERIKWNAPSYYYQQDLLTIHVKAQQHVHLIFHHIAIVSIESPLLEGAYKDRRMLYIKDLADLHHKKQELSRILIAVTEDMGK